MAWSSQGRHHCLRGGDEPRGLPGPVEGRGEREPAGRGVGRGAGRAWAAPPDRGGLAVQWGERTVHRCRRTVAGWPAAHRGTVSTWHRTDGRTRHRPDRSGCQQHGCQDPGALRAPHTHPAPGGGPGAPGGGCGRPGSACASPVWRGCAPSWGAGAALSTELGGRARGPPPRRHLLSLQLGQGLLLRLAMELDALEVGRVVQREAPAGRRRHPGTPGARLPNLWPGPSLHPGPSSSTAPLVPLS